MRRLTVVLVLLATAIGSGSRAAAGPAAPIGGRATHPVAHPLAHTSCPVFPADDWWHADVRRLPLDPRGATWLAHMSPEVDLHPDFGPQRDGPGYGVPVNVVGGRHARVPVGFRFDSESDRVRYPLGADIVIEGGRDKHAIVVDKTRCRLYETFSTHHLNGRWQAGSGAVWSLRSDALRPDGWTSADAAGLPILAGLLRWSEVRTDTIDHAIRFTMPVSSGDHLWPARHDASSAGPSSAYPPMGARFRLDPSYDASALSVYSQRVVAAMKTYGLVLADHGSPWYFQGERNAHWPKPFLRQLNSIPASAFQAVDTSSLQLSPDSGAVR